MHLASKLCWRHVKRLSLRPTQFDLSVCELTEHLDDLFARRCGSAVAAGCRVWRWRREHGGILTHQSSGGRLRTSQRAESGTARRATQLERYQLRCPPHLYCVITLSSTWALSARTDNWSPAPATRTAWTWTPATSTNDPRCRPSVYIICGRPPMAINCTVTSHWHWSLTF